MIVADANLIIYRFVAGPFSAQADAAVRKDPNWRTVPLWRYEFTNALTTMVRNNVLSETDAMTAIAAADVCS